MRHLKKISVSILWLFLSACTTQPSVSDLLGEAGFSEQELLAESPFPGSRDKDAIIPTNSILQLSPAMRQLADSIPDRPPGGRLKYLLKKLDSQNFSVYYDADATLTASEVFSERRGNCMAFSAMMVALVRELGVEAHFNHVNVPPTWHLEQEQTVVYQHINALVKTSGDKQVIDFNFVGYNPNYHQVQITDEQAFARFYSNIAMDYLDQGDYQRAYRHLQEALRLAPEEADLWNNLGAVYRRAGYTDRGAAAYQIALQHDFDNLSALSNLERLLREKNQQVVADKLASQLSNYRQKNPYYWYARALNSYRNGAYDSAIDEAKDAIAIENSDHRFYFLLGMARYKLGSSGYKRNFQQALDLAGTDDNRRLYMRKMEVIGEDLAEPSRGYRPTHWSEWMWW